MGFKIIISPRAQKEIENSIEYYTLQSNDLPKYFINQLKNTFSTLEINPYYKICYKNIRSLKIKNFPHSLYFIINEQKNTLKILSCFHNKRNPNKRP